MKVFIFVLSMFIGILAYNIYVPTDPGYNGSFDALRNYRDSVMPGVFVGLFFGLSSLVGFLHLYQDFEKRRSK
jgi:hypothetical protein